MKYYMNYSKTKHNERCRGIPINQHLRIKNWCPNLWRLWRYFIRVHGVPKTFKRIWNWVLLGEYLWPKLFAWCLTKNFYECELGWLLLAFGLLSECPIYFSRREWLPPTLSPLTVNAFRHNRFVDFDLPIIPCNVKIILSGRKLERTFAYGYVNNITLWIPNLESHCSNVQWRIWMRDGERALIPDAKNRFGLDFLNWITAGWIAAPKILDIQMFMLKSCVNNSLWWEAIMPFYTVWMWLSRFVSEYAPFAFESFYLTWNSSELLDITVLTE